MESGGVECVNFFFRVAKENGNYGKRGGECERMTPRS